MFSMILISHWQCRTAISVLLFVFLRGSDLSVPWPGMSWSCQLAIWHAAGLSRIPSTLISSIMQQGTFNREDAPAGRYPRLSVQDWHGDSSVRS